MKSHKITRSSRTRSVKARRGSATETVNGKETKRHLPKKTFKEEPALVNYRNGATLNLGNYQSARVDIGITMPCSPKKVNATLNKLIKDVDERVAELAENYKADNE